MTDTARLLSALGSSAVHAHKPGVDDTLCGMDVIDWDHDEEPPARTAVWTGVRFYDGGDVRMVCQRCVKKAPRARQEMAGQAVPLQEVREA